MQNSGVTLLGSVTKLQIIDANKIDAINNISAASAVNFSNIVLVGGASWETVEILPEAGYKIKASDTANGQLQTAEISVMLMNNNNYELLRLTQRRVAALITDGDGLRWLIGNKEQPLMPEIDTDSKTSRGKAKTNTITFKGAINEPIMLVL